MQATVKNIYMEGFNTADPSETAYQWQVTLQEEDGTPMLNLANATSTFRIKRSYADETPLLVATELDGIVIDDVQSTVRLILKASHFTNFTFNREEQEFLYDWDLTDGVNRNYRLYKGTVTLGGDI